MSNISFTEIAFEEYTEWQFEDRKTIKRINNLIKSIVRDGPLAGIGKPEKLSYYPSSYSRRIDEKNRLVYEIIEDQIIIKSCKGHYDD